MTANLIFFNCNLTYEIGFIRHLSFLVPLQLPNNNNISGFMVPITNVYMSVVNWLYLRGYFYALIFVLSIAICCVFNY